MKGGEEENYTKSGFDILFLFYDAYHTISEQLLSPRSSDIISLSSNSCHIMLSISDFIELL